MCVKGCSMIGQTVGRVKGRTLVQIWGPYRRTLAYGQTTYTKQFNYASICFGIRSAGRRRYCGQQMAPTGLYHVTLAQQSGPLRSAYTKYISKASVFITAPHMSPASHLISPNLLTSPLVTNTVQNALKLCVLWSVQIALTPVTNHSGG